MSALKPIVFVLFVLLLVTNLITWVTLPNQSLLNIGTSTLVAVLFVLLVLIYKKQVVGFLKSDQFKQWRSYSLTVFLLFGIFSLLSHLAFKNDYYFDLTGGKFHSLSSFSKSLVKRLDSKLEVHAFVSSKDRDQYASFIDLYRNFSTQIELHFHDPNKSPLKVKEYGITSYGQLALSYKNKTVLVGKATESEFSNALQRVLSTKRKLISYTVGHREVDLSGSEKSDASYLQKLINDSGIELLPINLLTQSLPKDLTALLIPGPIDSFATEEINKIKKYLGRGGRLFIALSPSLKDNPHQNLRAMLSEHGVKMSNRVLLDRLAPQQNIDPSILIFQGFKSNHQMFKQFDQRTIFPVTSDIDWNEGAKVKMRFFPLIQTQPTPATWAESDSLSLLAGKVSLDENDRKCPCPLVGLYEEITERPVPSKIVAIGNGNFFINGYKAHAGNFNLFLNLINWLADDFQQISKDRPQLQTEAVIMSTPHLRLIFICIVVVIPIAFFLLALGLHRRRGYLA